MPERDAPRRCLVTGGAGFIGSHLCEQLLTHGCSVVVIDNLSTGRRQNLAGISTDVEFIEGDTAEVLPQLTPGSFDEVYHLAAAVGVRLVIERPVQTIRTNVLDTMAVLEFVTRSQTPVLIASSSEVYGKSTKTPFSEDDDVVYGPTVYSRWSYACSKAIDEYLALAYVREHNLPVVISRFFNTVGPRQVGEYGMVIPRFVSAALKNEPIQVYGDGQQSRCFCDVRDIVRVLPALLQEAGRPDPVINVGSDRSITIAELAELVVDVVGSDSELRFVPYEKAFGAGFDDLRHRQPDLTRLRSIVPFVPAISLEQTITDLARDIRAGWASKTAKAIP